MFVLIRAQDVDIKLNEEGAEVARRRHSEGDAVSSAKAPGEM